MASDTPLEGMAESELLQTCPRCLYTLIGLPLGHRCPECGLEIDRRWRCYGGLATPRKSRGFDLPLRIWLCIVTGAAVVAMMLAMRSAARNERWILILAMLLPAGALAFVLFWRPRRFLAIGPDGLVVCQRGWRLEHYPWPRLGRARHGFPRKVVLVELDGRDLDIPTNFYFGLHMMEMDRFVREFNAFPRGDAAAPRPG